jgi:nucleoside-diphosphate-sugar epimerase
MHHAAQDCDAVVHCAGLTKTLDPREFYLVNEEGVGKLVTAAREAGVKRFIFCSSQAAAGPSQGGVPVTEADEPRPISEYGRSKLAGEMKVRELAGEMEWLILRPPAVIGPRDWQFLPLYRGVVKLGLYPRFGSGVQLYSFVSVHDLARALFCAGQQVGEVNKTYFVARPEAVDWRDASRLIAGFAGRKVYSLSLPVGLAEIVGTIADVLAPLTGKPALLSREKVKEILAEGWICSSEAIRRDWRFDFEYDLTRTLRSAYDFYKSIRKL